MKTYKSLIILLFAGFALQGVAQDNLSPERKQAIDSLALEKVRDLSKYISLIGDKDTPFSEANRVIDRAVELFMEGSEVGVSSLYKEEINYYQVREYLERLMRLNYSKVDIEWYKIEYVSDLERQPDGTYVGVITIFQKFSGYDQEGGLVYQDVTKKDITVYVKRKETQIAGKLIGFWDVLLGDIRVKETTKE
ncbi:MAG TPA: hypothetical protein P5514_14400 [Bacteroidales bacterium]|nr:hypothetical protein [Bacteroidales bacterium]HPE58035.1 hypothetical protein [Bacteroidales bacterium]HRX98136.1 hypothetical protein [Bacteroidales bacterium]